MATGRLVVSRPAVGAAMLLLAGANAATPQVESKVKQLTTEQVFKNIQVLRGIPVDEVLLQIYISFASRASGASLKAASTLGCSGNTFA